MFPILLPISHSLALFHCSCSRQSRILVTAITDYISWARLQNNLHAQSQTAHCCISFCKGLKGSSKYLTEVAYYCIGSRLSKPPSDWKRSPGRPNHTWRRATESDLRPLNIGPSYAWKKAASREHWRSIVEAATIKKCMPFSAVKDNKMQLNDILFKIRHVSLCRPKSHNAKIQRSSLSNFE